MKQDKDLMFLATCQNEDLRTLCDFLIYNKKGELRMSEQLSNSDAFLRHYPERMYLMTTELSEELRKYGSNAPTKKCKYSLKNLVVPNNIPTFAAILVNKNIIYV